MSYYYYVVDCYGYDLDTVFAGTNRKKAIRQTIAQWTHLSRYDKNRQKEFYLACSRYKLAKDCSNYDKVFENARIIYDCIAFDNIATYYNDDIREELHFTLANNGNEKEFLKEYLKKDPDFIDIVRYEFPTIYNEL